MNTVLVKVDEAVGPVLDWLVAKAKLGKSHAFSESDIAGWARDNRPSESRHHCVVLMETQRLGVYPSDSVRGRWCCRPHEQTHPHFPIVYANSPMVAVARCFVVARLGPEVAVPAGLVTKGRC